MSESVLPSSSKRRLIDRNQVWKEFLACYQEGSEVTGVVHRLKPYGAFVEFMPGLDGLVHRSEILPGQLVEVAEYLWPGDRVRAIIQRIDPERRHVDLSIAASLDEGTQPRAAARGAALPGSLRKHEEVQSSLNEFSAKPGRIRRVLIGEDSLDLRRAHATLLRDAEFEVVEVKDAASAQEKTRVQQFDLVLLDLDTPKAGSISIAAEILQRCPDSDVVLMTGVPLTDEDRDQLAQTRVADVLQKPFRIRDLEALLERLESHSESWWQQDESSAAVAASAELEVKVGQKQGLHQAVTDLLEDLRDDTGATAGAVFGMDLLSREAELLTSVGNPLLAFEDWRRDLDLSPVKDVIIDNEHILEEDAEMRSGKYKYLLPLLPFRSCIGLPLTSAGSRRYALFLFHPSPAAFTTAHRERARHVAVALNALIERYQIEESLQTAAAFALIGQLSASLAHEVNNRVGALDAQVALLERYLRIVEDAIEKGISVATEVLGRIGTQVRAARKTVDRLHGTSLLFQRLAGPQPDRQCYLHVVSQRAQALLDLTARRYKIQLSSKVCPDLPPVLANEVALEQVLVNLLLNAIQLTSAYRQEHGWVRLEACRASRDTAWPIEVRVSDNGPGIHRRWWSLISDLGFTTRPGGSGLGLFVANSLVESFGGKLYVEESLILTGTTFVVALPEVQG